MPYDDPDPNDPHELVGVTIPASPETTRDMAYVFAEEFARMGMPRERILWLFRYPFYAGAHGAYRELGADAIAEIVEECVAVWGRVQPVDHAASETPRDQRPLGERR
jgi:hypothetical protein